MAIHRLRPGDIKKLIENDSRTKHSDGGGLILQVNEPGQASWVFRYKDRETGKERWPCIGPAATYSLDEAREKARLARIELREGRSPFDYLTGGRAELAGKLFSTALAEYLSAKSPSWAASNRARELRRYQFLFGLIPDFVKLPLRAITQDHKNAALAAFEVDSKKRRDVEFYIGAVLRFAETGKLRLKKTGDNVEHHAAMPCRDLPSFYRRLVELDNIDARALAFTILSGSRTDEVIGAKHKGKWTKLPATWAEITEEEGEPVWAIPDDRMKAGKKHSVPITLQMVALLGPRRADDAPLFKVSSQNALLNTLRAIDGGSKVTVHGFRSSFEDWGAEATSFPRDLVKLCTAHDTRTKTDRAYQRSALLAKRREIMTAWSDYVTSK
jgi:integrase